MGRPAAGQPQVPRRRRGRSPSASGSASEVATNTPYDQFVRDDPDGHRLEPREPRRRRTSRSSASPTATMENTTQLFLAVRFNCNKCHDHPFERWTQDQYYQTAAYFAQVGLKADPEAGGRTIGGTAVETGKPLFEIVADTSEGEVDARPDRPGRPPPKFPYPAPSSQAAETATPPRAAGRLDHLAGQPVLRPELRQPALGLPARRRHHRAARRHPRRQPADQSRAARLPDQGVHRERLRRPARACG